MIMYDVIMDNGQAHRESTHLLLCLSVLVPAAPEMVMSACIRYAVINLGPLAQHRVDFGSISAYCPVGGETPQ